MTPKLPHNRIISGGRRVLGYYHLHVAIRRIDIRTVKLSAGYLPTGKE